MKKLLLIIAAIGLLSATKPTEILKEGVLKIGIFERKETLSLRVNILKTEGDVVKIKLMDQDGKLVYSNRSVKSGHLVSFNFDFANAKSGEYLLIASSGNNVVKKEILKIQNALSY